MDRAIISISPKGEITVAHDATYGELHRSLIDAVKMLANQTEALVKIKNMTACQINHETIRAPMRDITDISAIVHKVLHA